MELNRLISICVQLAEEGGRTIRKVLESGDIQEVNKSTDEHNPVTIADFTVQRTIEHVLAEKFPELRMVGEEDPSDYHHLIPTVSADDLNDELITQAMLSEHLADRMERIPEHLRGEIDENPLEVNLSEATIFVDPLDGTRDFVTGNPENVTCLIGIAINNKSKIGVVHRPFLKNENSKTGITYFGSLETGLFSAEFNPAWGLEEYESRPIKYYEPFEDKKLDDEDELNVVVTASRFNDKVKTMIDCLQPCKFSQFGGAGNKLLKVFTGESDAYIYPSKGMGGWDVCAPEALLKAQFGRGADFRTEDYVYTPDMDKIYGAFMIGRPGYWEQCVKRLARMAKI